MFIYVYPTITIVITQVVWAFLPICNEILFLIATCLGERPDSTEISFKRKNCRFIELLPHEGNLKLLKSSKIVKYM